jgi:glucokinase
VFADNDARAAWRANSLSAARGHANALMLTLGTGVGGAVVVAGFPWAWGAAATSDTSPWTRRLALHLWQPRLHRDRLLRAPSAEAFAAAHRGCDTVLTAELERGTLNCEAVFRAAREGDEIARRIIARATKALGASIAGLFHAFDPEIMILGGQIAEAGESLFDALREETAWRTERLLRRRIPIVPAQLGDRAGIVGAAA